MTREEFMDYVYELLSSDQDNIRANLIIEAADEYCETEIEAVKDRIVKVVLDKDIIIEE